jgi:hypothetical protein
VWVPGGASNFKLRGHAKKVDVVLISWCVCEQSGQKIHRLDNYRENWVMFAPPIRAKRLQWKIAFTSALPSRAKRTKWYVKCAYKNQSPLILNAFGKTNLYSQIRCSVAGNIDQLIALTNCNRCEQIAFFMCWQFVKRSHPNVRCQTFDWLFLY